MFPTSVVPPQLDSFPSNENNYDWNVFLNNARGANCTWRFRFCDALIQPAHSRGKNPKGAHSQKNKNYKQNMQINSHSVWRGGDLWLIATRAPCLQPCSLTVGTSARRLTEKSNDPSQHSECAARQQLRVWQLTWETRAAAAAVCKSGDWVKLLEMLFNQLKDFMKEWWPVIQLEWEQRTRRAAPLLS